MPPTKTIFLSSVAAGVESYRSAVYGAISGLEGFRCIRMEDFGSHNAQPLEICLQKVSEADIFVGIIGHRYGSCPPGHSQSYTELEYEAALAQGKPCLMFLAPEEHPVPAHQIEKDEQRAKQKRFRDRVGGQHLWTTYKNEDDLAAKVLQGIHNAVSRAIQNERERIVAKEAVTMPTVPSGPDSENLVTYLLFPFVTNQSGFDTGIAVSNTATDPFGTRGRSGTCTIHYYGRMYGGAPAPDTQVSGVIYPGDQLLFVLSSGGNLGITGTPDFQGYLIIECRFPHAYGYAFVSDGPIGESNIGTGYLAKRINSKRDD